MSCGHGGMLPCTVLPAAVPPRRQLVSRGAVWDSGRPSLPFSVCRLRRVLALWPDTRPDWWAAVGAFKVISPLAAHMHELMEVGRNFFKVRPIAP